MHATRPPDSLADRKPAKPRQAMPQYNPPPNWPAPPPGWTPPEGWKAPANWPAPPKGWQLWLPAKKEGSWFGRHKVLTGVGGGLAALMLIGSIASAADDRSPNATATPTPGASSTATKPTPTTTPSEPKPKPTEEPRARKGETVKSGGLQFTVSKVKCGVTRIGDDDREQLRARGASSQGR